MTDQPVTPDSASLSPATTDANPSSRASIDRAFASVAAADTAPETGDAAPPAETAPSFAEVPSRFSTDAKSAWPALPDAIKAETWRALRELESGIGRYQKDFEPLKPWLDLARQHNTTLPEAMERYTALDRALLSAEPEQKLAAINAVLAHAGIDPADFAKQTLAAGKPPGPTDAEAPLNELRRAIADLRSEMGGITSSLADRRRLESQRELSAFAKDHTRLADPKFQETFNRLLETGMAEGLEAAYAMADRLDPLPPAPKDQTLKGQLSISGAPASGSNPLTRKPPVTPRESLDRSFASLGLG
jgi:hypothetical protein